MPVSYTHLDVYKRQIYILMCACKSEHYTKFVSTPSYVILLRIKLNLKIKSNVH